MARIKAAMATLAFCILITSTGSSEQQVAAQPEGKIKVESSTSTDFRLLEFQKCMPAIKRKFTATTRRKHGKIVIGPIPDSENRYKGVKGAQSLHNLAEDYYQEYAILVQKSLSLSEKIQSDPKNEALLREVKMQMVELQNVADSWLASTIEMSQKIIAKYPNYTDIVQVHYLLGEALWWSGEEKKALKVLRDLIKKHPESKELPRTYMFIGEYYLNRGNLEKAIEAFKKTASEKGHECAPCAEYRIAYCYLLSGDTGKAIEWFKKAVSVSGEGSSIRTNSARAIRQSQDMVHVPAGWFWMGCNPDLDKDCSFNEKPGRKIYLEEFWIDRTEVTISEYDKCIRAGSCTKEGLWGYPWPGVDDSYGPKWCERFGGMYCSRSPVLRVSWKQARLYCEWSGKRLPTEAEWEKAARGTDGRIYPWGNEGYEAGKPVANIVDKKYSDEYFHPPIAMNEYYDGFFKVAPTGSYPNGSSPYGALDMVGNVWEWVADWYKDGYDKSAPNRNPKGPKNGKYRVIRGCSFNDLSKVCRASARFRAGPEHHKSTIGFRCAADVVK